MAAYGGMVAALAALARFTGRKVPADLSWTDVIRCAAATQKLSRLLAKDPVTSPLRAPFTRYQGQSGPAELQEEVRGIGARKAVGELITCPFCIDMWVATGLVAGFVFLPRVTRLATDTLAVLAGADLLQFGYALIEEKEQS
jgi:hypothetical protein